MSNRENNPPPVTQKLVLCPECGTEVNLKETDDCPKCELNVARVYEQARYRRALKKLEQDDDEPKDKRKKKDWNLFGE
jgi:uncharacterized paraquat-inducible protein A